MGRRLLDARQDAGGTSSVSHRYLGSLLLSTTVQLVEGGPVYRVKYHRPLAAAGQSGARSAVTLVIDPTDQMHRLQRVDAGALRRDFASGTTEVAQYDSDGQCLAKASEGASGLRRRRFLRSAEGDLLERQDEARGTTRYRYDEAHRLTGVQSPDGAVHEYAHDAAGNLLQKPGLSEGYVAGVQAGPAAAVAFDTSHVALSRGNKLYRANGDRFHYDARDHVVAREGSWGRLTYVRDGLGRMRRIDWTAPSDAAGSTAAGPDGSRTATTWEAEYDALGRRTKKVVQRADANGTTVRDEWRFVWDGDRLVAEVMPEVVDPDGQTRRPVRLYVYPDAVALVPMLAIDYASLDAPPESGRVYALFTDHRGAVERVEDMQGAVVWEADLGPYGEAVVSVGAGFHQPFRLVGQYYDAETGLCAHRYRMYSPELGRFLESDPIGLAGGLNVYAWPGCPLVASDPLGLDCGDGDAPPVHRDAEADAEAAALRLDEPGSGRQSVRARIDSGVAKLAPDSPIALHPERYYFEDGHYHLRPSAAAEGSARSQHYPSGFQPDTHATMAQRHTVEGRDHVAAHRADPEGVPAPPPVRGADAEGRPGRGEPLERHQMTWTDEETGKVIPYYMQDRNADGTPMFDENGQPVLKLDRHDRPITNLTYGHEPPLAQRWNEDGHETPRSGRVADYNDVGPDPGGDDAARTARPTSRRLTPQGRRENSSAGSGGQTYDAEPSGRYFDDE